MINVKNKKGTINVLKLRKKKERKKRRFWRVFGCLWREKKGGKICVGSANCKIGGVISSFGVGGGESKRL